MNVQDVVNRSIQIRQKYDQLNTKNDTKWEAEDFMSGFVGDVGDLSKLVMAKRGLRGSIDADIDEKLAHELADCLWSVCILADKYDIDLEAAFLKTMDELDDRLSESLA